VQEIITVVLVSFKLANWREFGFGEGCAESVLRTDGGLGAIEGIEGPGDVESGVVPRDRAFSSRVVEISGLVEDFGGVGEDEKAVGEAFGDPEKLKVVVGGLGFEVESSPLSEVGGVAAQVDCDIPDMTGEDADKFALGLAELIVQAAEHTFDRERLIVLNKLGGETGCGKS
jgi:hypothetical protein